MLLAVFLYSEQKGCRWNARCKSRKVQGGGAKFQCKERVKCKGETVKREARHNQVHKKKTKPAAEKLIWN